MAMNKNTTPSPIISLEELQARRDLLREEIVKDDEQIKALWNSLFHKPAMLTSSSPSKRIAGILSTGAGVLDGVILGWKLYRKFKKK